MDHLKPAEIISTLIEHLRFRNYSQRTIRAYTYFAGKYVAYCLAHPEVTLILNQIRNPRHKAMIALKYGSGRRVNEVVNLRVGDCLLEKKRLVIRQSKNAKDRAGPFQPKDSFSAWNLFVSSFIGYTQGDMTGYTWQVQKTINPRFPFRIAIMEDVTTVLALRAQDKWPGQKGNIFCVRENGPLDDSEALEPVESVPIAFLRRQGKRVEIVLDRATRKRCDFLFLKKENSSGGVYEQIFFRTQTGMSSHRSKGSPHLYGTEKLEIVVDSAERYPWRFPGADITRDKLPAGDYALVWENRYIAVTERKTFDNLLHDLYEIRIFHQKLGELSSFPNPALVVEAQYGDFSDKNRLGDRLSAPHLNRLLGEISALHPGLQFIFAGNRKLANAWTARFFAAVRSRFVDAGQTSAEAAERPPTFIKTAVREDLEIRKRILEEFGMIPGGFRMKELKDALPGVDATMLRRVLNKLKRDGKVYAVGKASGTRWLTVLPDHS